MHKKYEFSDRRKKAIESNLDEKSFNKIVSSVGGDKVYDLDGTALIRTDLSGSGLFDLLLIGTPEGVQKVSQTLDEIA